MKYQDVVDAWNELADPQNQWGELGEDEKIEFAIALENRGCIHVIKEYQYWLNDTSRAEISEAIRARSNK